MLRAPGAPDKWRFPVHMATIDVHAHTQAAPPAHTDLDSYEEGTQPVPVMDLFQACTPQTDRAKRQKVGPRVWCSPGKPWSLVGTGPAARPCTSTHPCCPAACTVLSPSQPQQTTNSASPLASLASSCRWTSSTAPPARRPRPQSPLPPTRAPLAAAPCSAACSSPRQLRRLPVAGASQPVGVEARVKGLGFGFEVVQDCDAYSWTGFWGEGEGRRRGGR